MNPLQFAVYPLGALCCWWGSLLARRHPHAGWLPVLLLLLALPSVAYGVYYLRVWHEPIWLYRMRSVPGTELLASLGGLLVGWGHARIGHRFKVSLGFVGCWFITWLTIPYLKQIFTPLDRAMLKEKWKDGVCLQSSTSTCGPASAATLMHALGVTVTEKDLATHAFTTRSGTENWYLKRAIERHGATCHYMTVPQPSTSLPYPAIAGVKLGSLAGHFIAILGETPDHYIIGEPMMGLTTLRKDRMKGGRYEFTGFFMLIEKRKEH